MKRIAFVVAFVATTFACTGATSRVLNGVDTADYGAALLRCKEEGKDAGSRLVYFRCANEVDRRFDASTFDGGL